jgi:hypothetical protein
MPPPQQQQFMPQQQFVPQQQQTMQQQFMPQQVSFDVAVRGGLGCSRKAHGRGVCLLHLLLIFINLDFVFSLLKFIGSLRWECQCSSSSRCLCSSDSLQGALARPCQQLRSLKCR